MKKLLVPIFVVLFGHISFGQLSITSVDTDFTIDFEATVAGVNNGTFTAAGFTVSPTAGQLDSDGFSVLDFSDGDVAFGGTGTGNDHTRGSSPGGVTTAGIYAFDIGSGDIILGVQPSGTEFNNGSIRLAFVNNTGGTVSTINVAYNVSNYNDQNRSNTIGFSYSPDDITYYNLASMLVTTTEVADGSPAWQTDARSISITGLNITNGSTYYLSWDGGEAGGSGSRDEVGIDDIVISLGTANLDIIITEVMYNPNSVDSSWEWVEIYNNSSSNIDLSSFVFDDDDDAVLSGGNISAGLLLAGSALIIMDEGAITQANFTSAWGSGIGYATTSGFPNALGNTGDRIGIWTNLSRYNSRDFTNAIDEITYENNSNGWPNDDGSASIYYNDGTFSADNNVGSNWSLSGVSTATPVGSGFQSSINGTTNTGADIGSPAGDVALPVTLVSLAGRVTNDKISISWETASEINNDRFEIERSDDGVRFSKIGTMNGNGNSRKSISYEFIDNAPFIKDNFYRLKQVDFDGSFERSYIIGPFSTLNAVATLNIFPNPAKLSITLTGSFEVNKTAEIVIVNVTGQVVLRQQLSIISEKAVIPLPKSLPNGTYYLSLTQGDGKMNTRFFKHN